MTHNEKLATSRLKKTPDVPSDDESDVTEGGYFEQCQSKRRRLNVRLDDYIDCRFLVATSNTVERLFSLCKHVLTDTRKCMSPIMFESLIFLQVNRQYWDLQMVAIAMKKDNLPRGSLRDSNTFYPATS